MQRFAASSLLALVGFYALAWLAEREGIYAALGAPIPSAHVALLLAFVAAPVVGFFLMPVKSAWARHQELEADDYAARHSDTGALAAALVKIHRDNRAELEPDPLYWKFYATHPAPQGRIARLRSGPKSNQRGALAHE